MIARVFALSLCVAIPATSFAQSGAEDSALPHDFLDQRPMIQLFKAYAEYKMAHFDAARLMWEAMIADGNSASPDALFNLAGLYEDGLGVPQDHARAIDLYRQGANAGSALAAYRLGLFYANGAIVPIDEDQARRYFEMAAPDLADARDWLVRLGGDAAPDPLARAESLIAEGKTEQGAMALEDLADQGHIRARTKLAYLYESGKGVARDIEKAADLLGESAADGDAEAQYAFAVMLLSGAASEQDPDLARHWLTQAAAQGHGGAKQALAEMNGT